MKVKREKIKEIFLICYNSKKNYKRKNKDLDTGKVLVSYSKLEFLIYFIRPHDGAQANNCEDQVFTISFINKKHNLDK